ncbi:hypothetical protein D0Y65_016544 [Glycine soja]|uniref:Uncharacterized protein n=1 Tax=Glycine soja TaxID=3848 RepID=A0A445JQM9_GLYSO|nr:hypothetical protein D0Y65_016544 [Glycine soja]
MSEEGPPKLYTDKPRKVCGFGNSAIEAVSGATEIKRVLLSGGDGDTRRYSAATSATAKGTLYSALQIRLAYAFGRESWCRRTTTFHLTHSLQPPTAHGCLYPYSGHTITHHPQPPLQEPSLLPQHPPSPYTHPAQSLGIDFESTRIRLLALCGTWIPWFPSLVQPPPPPLPPPSMDPTTPTAMLEHQNTGTSSSAQPPLTTTPTSAPSSSAQPPPTTAPTSTPPPLAVSHHPKLKTVAPMAPSLPRFHTTNRHFQLSRLLPLSLRTAHCRYRHDHCHKISYGNDTILLDDDAVKHQIHLCLVWILFAVKTWLCSAATPATTSTTTTTEATASTTTMAGTD